MRWIRFSQQGRTAYGIVEGDRIVEVAGDPFGGYERTTRAHELDAVKIEVPVVPPTFYCVGLNYAEHIREAAAKLGIKAGPAQAARRRLSRHQRADRPRRAGRHPARCHQGAVRGRAGRRHRQAGQAPERGRGAVLRARLHHRQRRQRARLAEVRPHAVARQEHRHLQADGARGSRPTSISTRWRPRARQRQGDDALSHQRHAVRRRHLHQPPSPATSRSTPAT